jgi:hypothetical protein
MNLHVQKYPSRDFFVNMFHHSYHHSKRMYYSCKLFSSIGEKCLNNNYIDLAYAKHGSLSKVAHRHINRTKRRDLATNPDPKAHPLPEWFLWGVFEHLVEASLALEQDPKTDANPVGFVLSGKLEF